MQKAGGLFLAGNGPSEQLAARLLSTEALVGGTKLRTGELDEGEWSRLVEGGDILSKADIYLDDNSNITVPEMKAKIRRLKHVDLVIIDYLQLMNGCQTHRKPCAGNFGNYPESQDYGQRA